MPSTFRLLRNLLLIAACTFGVIWALATFVEPSPREMMVNVPIEQSAEP
ncbi:hypothetical protein [Terrihabitans sp. B22-R8]